MTGIKIDGKIIAQTVKDRVKKAADELKTEGINPCLATVLIGNNTASATYVKNKHKSCEEVGIATKDHKLDESVTQQELNNIIDELNADVSVHGILVQLPLPKHLNEFVTTSRISPIKDVDGLTPHNAGLLAMKKAALVACTPSGVMEMFDYHNIDLEGKNIVLINRSNLVGKPLYHLLTEKNATVITCHSKTKNIEQFCQSADIIITAVGDRTKFTLTPEMIKKEAIVIDVAISRFREHLVGDCDYEIKKILADFYRIEKKFELAVKIYSELIEEKPDDLWYTLYLRGICYEQSDNWEKAELDFLHSLRMKRNSPNVLNYLAYGWIERDIKIDESFVMLIDAYDANPDSHYILDSLAWAYFKKKDFVKAAELMEEVIDMVPGEAVSLDHLGDIYFAMNRKREAIYFWRQAKDLAKPADELIDNIESKLREYDAS